MSKLKNNYLIIDFLELNSGFKKYSSNSEDKGVFIIEIPYGKNVINYSLEELQFNTSWDWLMIVVNRINEINDAVYGVTVVVKVRTEE